MSQPSITTADLVIAQMSSSKPTGRTTTALTDDTPATPDELPLFEPYESPAGGWGALQATANALREQSVVLKGGKALLSMNQPDGFDCPGCAWPDPKHTSSFEFCDGAKAVAFELTSRRVTRDFFAAHTVRELEQHSDYWLEEQGRLTEPMRYDVASDHYVPIAWEEAFALIGRELRGLQSPDQAEFYTSGRTSNEAAFLYQIFVRRFGTNNFPVLRSRSGDGACSSFRSCCSTRSSATASSGVKSHPCPSTTETARFEDFGCDHQTAAQQRRAGAVRDCRAR
jgi:hypothetical protein